MTQKNRVVIVLFALSMMVSTSSSVFAQTGDIDPNGVAPAACVNLSTSLRYKDTDASTGGAVSNLQEFLIAKGYMNTEATGFFGSITFASVQKYQAAKGFSSSGFVGDYTRAAIKTDSCNGTSSQTTTGTTQTTNTTSTTSSTANTGRTPTGYIVSQGNNGNTCSIILGRSTCAVTISWLSNDYALSPRPVALTTCESNGGGCITTEERYEGASGVRSFTLRNGVKRIFSIVGYDFTGNMRKAMELILQTDCSSGAVWNGSVCVTSNGSGNIVVNTTSNTGGGNNPASSSPCFVIGPGTTCAPGTSPTASFAVDYNVKGDGRILTSMIATVKGGGPNLKACSGQASARFVTGAGQVTPCSADADFVFLKNQAGWSYNATTDTYSFNGNVASSGFPDTTYFTNFILSNGKRETKLFSTAMTSTAPTSSSPTTSTPCFVVGPGAECGGAYVKPRSTTAWTLVSNSPTGPFVVYAYNQGKMYSQTTGLIKANNPKGCAQPAGLSTCLNPANFRDFTSSEWVNDTTVITSIDGGTIPSGYYESYVMSSTEAPIIAGSFTIYPTPTTSPSSPTSSSPCFVTGAGQACGASTSNLNATVSAQGNGSILTQVNSTVSGGGPNLRACTGPVSSKATGGCSTDAEFAYLKNQAGWSYNYSNDTYSMNMDVSSSGFPDTTYFTAYILSNGLRAEKTWGTTRTQIPFTVNVSTTGNGTILTTMYSTILGGGPNLRACSARLSGQSSGACSTEAEYAYLKNQSGWSYVASSDTYIFNSDVSNLGFPDVSYFTNYILSDGTRTTKTFNLK